MLRAPLALMCVLALAGCDTRFNPLNWFGGDREQRVSVDPSVVNQAVDPRPLVTEITQLSVEQTTSGAIVRATGITPSQGFFEADLVPVERSGSALVYEFRAASPVDAGAPGIQNIVAGISLSVGELQGIRSITVIAATNRRSVSRR